MVLGLIGSSSNSSIVGILITPEASLFRGISLLFLVVEVEPELILFFFELSFVFNSFFLARVKIQIPIVIIPRARIISMNHEPRMSSGSPKMICNTILLCEY